MRIAYVGLAGPLVYDYGQPASAASGDLQSSPNPILDSPYGLMLLYDEIWFLSRSMCPDNMRELDYVHFLDEEGKVPDLSGVDVAATSGAVFNTAEGRQRYERVTELFHRWDEVLARMCIDWDASPDNHTHGLSIGGKRLIANSLNLDSVLIDLEVVERLGDDRVELVANSFGQRWIEDANPSVRSADLAHVFVIERIPNWVSPSGPYHPVVDEARDNPYLRDFRRWITETSNAATVDAKEVADVKAEVEAALEESRDRIFLQYLDERRRYESLGKTLVAEGANFVVPFSGTFATVIQNIKEARSAKDIRWQGFLVGVGQAAREYGRHPEQGR